jgi:hypothetical protein
MKLKWKSKRKKERAKVASFFFRMIYRCCLRNTIKNFTKNVTINFYLTVLQLLAYCSLFYRLLFYSNKFLRFFISYDISTRSKKKFSFFSLSHFYMQSFSPSFFSEALGHQGHYIKDRFEYIRCKFNFIAHIRLSNFVWKK